VDNEKNTRNFDIVYSNKIKAGKRRTYFFDVRQTKSEDYYLTLTESTKRSDGSYEKHKLFLYKEDFNRFVAALGDTLNHIKTELMPDYDYDEFTRRAEEYERLNNGTPNDPMPPTNAPLTKDKDLTPPPSQKYKMDEDDMSW
jgi:Protein of unknown function (DUF3276)